MIIEGDVTTLNLKEFEQLPPCLVTLGYASSGYNASFYNVKASEMPSNPTYFYARALPKNENYSYFIRTKDWYLVTCKLKDILV